MIQGRSNDIRVALEFISITVIYDSFPYFLCMEKKFFDTINHLDLIL